MSPLVSDNHLAEKPSVSTDDMTLLREAAASHKTGDKEKARALLRQAAEINPSNELVLLWQASLAQTAVEAMTAIEKVLDLNPNNDKAMGWKVKLEARFPSVARPASNGHANVVTAATPVVEESEPEAEAVVETVEVEETTSEIDDQQVAESVEEGPDVTVDDEAAAAEEAASVNDESAATSIEEGLEAAEEESKTVTVDRESEEKLEELIAEAVSAETDSIEIDEEADSIEKAESDSDEAFYSIVAGDESDAEVEVEAVIEESAETVAEENDSAEDFWSQASFEETAEEETADQDTDEEPYDSTARALEALDQHVSEAIVDEEDDDPIRRLLAEKSDDASAESYESQPDSVDPWDSAEIETESLESEEETTSDDATLLAMLAQDTSAPEETDENVDAGSHGVVETIVNTHWECPLCGQQSHRVEPSCPTCKSIVDLTRVPDMALNEGVDRVSLKRLVADWEDQVDMEPDAELYTKIALAYLNLRQSNAALPHLLSAARMDRENDALAGALEQVSRRPLILVVDDSRTVQRMVLSTLEKELFRVQIAEDGLQALAKLNDETPSLILLDITMPRMDGYQVCKVITGNDMFKHIPVVMLSGKDGFFDKVRGRMVGAKDYITKPFKADLLVKTVRKRIETPAI